MSLVILNDLHCGLIRSGGTTPKTAWALRQYNLARFEALLDAIKDDLLILGDLLDTFSIPYLDLLRVYELLQNWLTANPDSSLFLVQGNHDLSKTTTTLSSFQFLCEILATSSRVVVFDKPGRVKGHDAYVIPHLINQDQFDIELTKVPDDVHTLLVHANYDNKFAQQSDHSLNVSHAQAVLLPVKRIVFAHEHQQRTALKGKVQVIGNQIPTSVADCLNNESKRYLEIKANEFIYHTCWEATGSFVEVDWHELATLAASEGEFIRVVGDAAASEANAVVSAISKLRNVHNAFVITNAVKIEGRALDGESRSLEQAKNYDVREQIMRRLSPEQRAAVEALLAEHGEQA